jgi:hypothetical protein
MSALPFVFGRNGANEARQIRHQPLTLFVGQAVVQCADVGSDHRAGAGRMIRMGKPFEPCHRLHGADTGIGGSMSADREIEDCKFLEVSHCRSFR